MNATKLLSGITLVGNFCKSYLGVSHLPDTTLLELLEQTNDKLSSEDKITDLKLFRQLVAFNQVLEEFKLNGMSRMQYDRVERQRYNEYIENNAKRTAKPEEIVNSNFGGTISD
jgi:hypothetical protein